MKYIKHTFRLSFLGTLFLCLTSSTVSAQDSITKATDHSGDGYGDIIFYNPKIKTYDVRRSQDGVVGQHALAAASVGDEPVLGDFNNDNVGDLALFNRTTAVWSILETGGSPRTATLGSPGDFPVARDYDGDGKTDLASYSRQTGVWTIGDHNGANQITLTLGGPEHTAVPADYDCDGKADVAVFRESTGEWIIRRSIDSVIITVRFGIPGDIPVPGDYNSSDGQNCDKVAVHRMDSHRRYVGGALIDGQIVNVASEFQWGLPGDMPAPINVQGDAAMDYAIYRPRELTFYIMSSLQVFFYVPLPATFTLTNLPVIASLLNIEQLRNPVALDANGDGASDFASASSNRNAGTTTVSIQHSNGASETRVINSAADAFVKGDFDGTGREEFATVFVKNDGLLYWTREDGTEIQWGFNGDQPLTGDVLCDGKDELIVKRVINGLLYHYAYNFHGSNATDVQFGLEGDRIFYADVDNDGCDEIIAAREEINGLIHWYYRDFAGGATKIIQWGLVGDELLAPGDYNGDGSKDWMVARNLSGVKVIFIRYSLADFASASFPNYPWTFRVFGLASDTAFSGQYSGSNKDEIAVYRRGSGIYIFTHDRYTSFTSFGANADVIYPANGEAFIAGSGGGGGGGGSAGCSASAGTEGDFIDGANGALWKPVSESTGKVVFLLPPNYTNASVEILGNDGTQRGSVNRVSQNGHNGNRVHFYLNQTASQLSAYKAITVKVTRADNAIECRVVPEPTQRYD